MTYFNYKLSGTMILEVALQIKEFLSGCPYTRVALNDDVFCVRGTLDMLRLPSSFYVVCSSFVFVMFLVVAIPVPLVTCCSSSCSRPVGACPVGAWFLRGHPAFSTCDTRACEHPNIPLLSSCQKWISGEQLSLNPKEPPKKEKQAHIEIIT